MYHWLFILYSGEFIRDLVALESGGSGGVVWRIRANATKLVCAVGSRNGTEETKLLVLDFDVSDSNKWISVVRLIPPIFCCFAATVFLSTNSNEWHCEKFWIVFVDNFFVHPIFRFLVFGHFCQQSYKNTKILHNLCLHFARQGGQDETGFLSYCFNRFVIKFYSNVL